MDRKTKAEELFRAGYNCSQSVIGAFCDDLRIDFDTAMKISEGFGGGFGRMRLTCGAVSAMAMVAGMKLSRGSNDGDTRAEVYEVVHKMADEFKAINGTINCGELLGLTEPAQYTSMPESRTNTYYEKRPCVECVKDCVGIVEKYLDFD